MPRKPRSIIGGYVYHLSNRANAMMTFFEDDDDYAGFESILAEAQEHVALPLIGYCLLPDRWHMLVKPGRSRSDDVSEFMRWITITHTRRWHAKRNTAGQGHVYQGRFRSFPVQEDEHLLDMLKHIERAPLREGLTKKAEDWPWSSLWLRNNPDAASEDMPALVEPEVNIPRQWARTVNAKEDGATLEAIQVCMQRDRPYGDGAWLDKVVKKMDLGHTFRSRGRPRKSE